MSQKPIHFWNAVDIAEAIRRRDLSAREVMQAHLNRIEEVNPVINSLVSLIPESQAIAAADEADEAVRRGDDLGVLHGLPTAIKDLLDVEGFPTTFGSAAYASAPPAKRDSLLAKRIRDEGAIILAKTNTPEYGVGTLTFNPIFGVTRNPWDVSRHGGGSSGAAAALASGMLPIADGSDSGGSLRYPSSFCNTVGLRPTAGLVPSDGSGDGWSPHSVLGPMARNSRDAGLLMSAISGACIESPLSANHDSSSYLGFQNREVNTLRVAWSEDAGGLPIDPEVRRGFGKVRKELEAAGAVVESIEIDFSDADEAWEIIEMFGFFSFGWPGVEATPELYRPDFVRNVRQGACLSAKEIAHGLQLRTEIYRRTARLLQNYDVIITPATPVTAPDASLEWVDEIDGKKFDRYFLWQRLANRITMTSHPALVTPGGFTESGMPFGLQIVGRFGQDANLLAIGAGIEELTGNVKQNPNVTSVS